jgi:hypothetical protein
VDILRALKDTKFYLDQVCSDHLPAVQAQFFNDGMERLTNLIMDGEEREYRKLFQQDDERRGDPLG